jgi:hypothetical protein
MWKNKEGGNDFETMLNHLAEIGRKITTLRKKAEGPVPVPELNSQTPVTPTEPKEQSVMSFEHYDASPRSLSESFNTRQTQGDRAIYKAREIVAKLMEGLNIPTSDIYYLKSDITRYAGDGTPATGRISFQMPILTPQGDSRTIYADVDILLGGLQPPTFFTDGVNQKYAFSPEGVKGFLKGRDFEVMQNPKVEPETTFFEAPGHLAGRGGMAITKIALEGPGDIKPTETPELMPGT